MKVEKQDKLASESKKHELEAVLKELVKDEASVAQIDRLYNKDPKARH